MGADAHHHKETFITKYIFSQDHKMISKQYLITGLIMGIVGIAMSLLFRLQLAWPEQPFGIFESTLGKWAPDGVMDPNVYLALVTIHGTIMVFFVLTAGLSGTFSNLLIPLQIGARDMASGFLNMVSYWLFFLSSVVMLASLFVEAGPAAAGWTIYPPLSALPQAQPGSGLGMTLWLVSMAIFIASSLLGSLNYIVTVINLRTKGMSMTRLPLTIWANSDQFANQGNEHDSFASHHLGIFCNCNYRCGFIPSIAFSCFTSYYGSQFWNLFFPVRYFYTRRGAALSRGVSSIV